MDSGGLNLDGILKTVLSDPEMLRGAMTLAKQLSENASFGASEGEKKTEEAHRDGNQFKTDDRGSAFASGDAAWGASPYERAASAPTLPTAVGGNRQEGNGKPMHDRHRKLLEALSLYMDESKRGKLELVIRLLDLLELAGSMRQ